MLADKAIISVQYRIFTINQVIRIIIRVMLVRIESHVLKIFIGSATPISCTTAIVAFVIWLYTMDYISDVRSISHVTPISGNQ